MKKLRLSLIFNEREEQEEEKEEDEEEDTMAGDPYAAASKYHLRIRQGFADFSCSTAMIGNESGGFLSAFYGKNGIIPCRFGYIFHM